MPVEPTLSLVREAVIELAERDHVRLVWPDSPERQALMFGFAAVHHLYALARGLPGPVWDVERARLYTSITLPGAGWLATVAGQALAQVPIVGPMLAEVIRRSADDTIYFAPAVLEPAGRALAKAYAHERGHVEEQRRANALAWCVAYGTIPPFRAGMEAPCYGQALQVAAALGEPVKDTAARYRQTFASYDLQDEALALAEGLLSIAERSLDQDPPGLLGGPSLDVLRALVARGVALPFELPPGVS